MELIRGSSRAVVTLRAVLAAALTAGLVAAYYLAPLRFFDFGHPVRQWAGVLLLVAVLAGLVIAQIKLVLRGPMDAAIIGLPVVVCLSIVGFAAVYVVFGRQPGEFVGLVTRTDALYFTVSTLATVGFGDVHASGQGAEIVVILQIMFNLVFVAGALSVFGARLRGRIRNKYDATGTLPDG
jgi:voltage-gated potassium channel